MHGSLLNVDIEGISFVPTADVDVSIITDKWENEAVPNGSGPASVQSVKKVPGASGITLRVNSTELGYLKDWSNAAQYINFYMTFRDGSVWGCRGLLQLAEASTANGTQDITVQCETDWDISAA
jgi:hypothetical protein